MDTYCAAGLKGDDVCGTPPLLLAVPYKDPLVTHRDGSAPKWCLVPEDRLSSIEQGMATRGWCFSKVTACPQWVQRQLSPIGTAPSYEHGLNPK